MWIREPGKITDSLYFLGTCKTCLYLLKGRKAMIIGGGMSYIAPSLERQFSGMDFDLSRIKYLVIPHSHFDHCGAVPYLKRKFPWVEIVASEYCQQVFSKEKALDFIATMEKEMIEKLGLENEYQRLNLQFDGIQVDRVAAEGDIINLGDGIETHFIAAPGHTKCSMAIYVPKLKAMFPSDSAPFPIDDGSELSYPSAQYDFSLYMESLRKLAAYRVEICAFDHHGVFVADQAKSILQQGLKQTEKFKNYIMEQYQKTGNLDKIAQNLAAESAEKNTIPFLSLEFQTAIAKTVIRRILG